MTNNVQKRFWCTFIGKKNLFVFDDLALSWLESTFLAWWPAG